MNHELETVSSIQNNSMDDAPHDGSMIVVFDDLNPDGFLAIWLDNQWEGVVHPVPVYPTAWRPTTKDEVENFMWNFSGTVVSHILPNQQTPVFEENHKEGFFSKICSFFKGS